MATIILLLSVFVTDESLADDALDGLRLFYTATERAASANMAAAQRLSRKHDSPASGEDAVAHAENSRSVNQSERLADRDIGRMPGKIHQPGSPPAESTAPVVDAVIRGRSGLQWVIDSHPCDPVVINGRWPLVVTCRHLQQTGYVIQMLSARQLQLRDRLGHVTLSYLK